MNEQSIYEKPRLKNRFRELATLAAFTLGVGVLSMIVMDILIYPLTRAAVGNPRLFTALIKYMIIIIPVLAFIVYFIKKTLMLKREGLPARKIFSLIMFRPVFHITIVFTVILLTAVIISVIYILFQYNYYLLYRLSL